MLEIAEQVQLRWVGFRQGVLDGVFGFGALGFGLGFDRVEFEVGEDGFRAFDDGSANPSSSKT